MFAGGDEKVRADLGFGAGPMDKGPEFAAGLSYTPADTSAGQLPGLAQQLDPNKDGKLAAEEYAQGQASLDVSSAKLPEDFNQFRSLAVLSMSSPEAVQKILGTSAILGPEISAAEKEAEKKAAEHVAWTLVERAKQQDYLDARSTLGEAGSIFRQFGFNAEAEGCASQLKKRSEDGIKSSDAEIANLAKGDLELAHGVEAIKKGDIVGVKHALDSIPEGHEGRKVLEGYLADVEKAGRLEKEMATLTAAMGIAEKKMVKDKGDRAGHERMLKDLFEAWSIRVESGKFEDTEAILKDLWEKEPWVKPALAYLEGHESGFRVSGENLRQVEGWLFNGNKIVLGAPEIILTDLIAIEKGVDAKAFAQRAYEITSPGDRSIDEELIGNEFAVLADVYGKRDATKVYADECAKHTNVTPDFLFGATIAAPIGELAGAFTLLKASPLIWKVVSKLPFSKNVIAKIYGGAVSVTEASAVSGAFTAFEISKSILSHPEAKVSVKDVMMQWGSLDVCMIVARMAHVPLMRTRKAMGKSKLFAGKAGAEPVIMHGHKLPALNLLGRGTFAVIDNAAQAGAFYTGGKIAHGLGLRNDSPQFFQEWLSLMQFQIGGHLANKVTGGRVNEIAFKAKNRANIEASQKIAEKLAGGKGRAADAISEQIFMSHVRGDVEATALLRASDYLKGGKGGDRIDAVLETNALLKSAGVSDNTGKVALWDGARLLAVAPEARDAYIAELEAKKAENARRTLSPLQLAPAVADTGKTPAKAPATMPDTSVVKMSGKNKTGNEKTKAPAEKTEKSAQKPSAEGFSNMEEAGVYARQALASDETIVSEDLIRESLRFSNMENTICYETYKDLAMLGSTGAEYALNFLEYQLAFHSHEAMHALGETGAPKAIELLGKMLNDHNPQIQSAAKLAYCKAAGYNRDPANLKTLEQMSADANYGVRAAVAEAIGRIGDPAGFEILKKMANNEGDRSASVWASIARSLVLIGDPRGLEILKGYSGDVVHFSEWDRQNEVTIVAARFRLGDPKGLEKLRNIVSSYEMWCAAHAIGEFGIHEGIDILRQLIARKEDRTDQYDIVLKQTARASLVKLGDEAATNEVLLDAASPSGKIDKEEAEVLVAGLGPRRVIDIVKESKVMPLKVKRELLIAAMHSWRGKANDPLNGVPREKMLELVRQLKGLPEFVDRALVLHRLGDPEGLQILHRLKAKTNPSVRLDVAFAAVEIGGTEGVRILDTLKSDADRYVRRHVAFAAGEIGGKEGVRILDTLKSDANSYVRRYVAEAAGEIGGTEGVRILDTLKSDADSRVRVAVANSAGEIGGPEGVRILDTLKSDAAPDVREKVANSAGKIGGTEGVRILDTLKSDAEWDVREAVANSAGKIGGPEGVRILDTLKSDADPYVRKAVANSAGEIGGPEGAQILDTLKSDAEWDVRRAVANSAGEIGGPEGVRILDTLKSDAESDVRQYVAEALGKIGGTEGVRILDTLKSDANSYVREKIAEALGKIGGPEGVRILDELKSDPESGVHMYVAKALGKIGGKEGVQILDELKSDPESYVRMAIAKAAGEIGGIEGVRILDELKSDPDRDVRRYVAEAAGEIGGKDGVRILNELRSDPESYVHTYVAQAAGKIGGKTGFLILKSMDPDFNTIRNFLNSAKEAGGRGFSTFTPTPEPAREPTPAQKWREFVKSRMTEEEKENIGSEFSKPAATIGESIDAAEAAAYLGDAKALEYLRSEAFDEKRGAVGVVKLAALDALVRVDPQEGLKSLKHIVEYVDKEYGQMKDIFPVSLIKIDKIGNLLLKLDPDYAVETFRRWISGPNLYLRADAALLLGKSGIPEAFDLIEPIIRETLPSSSTDVWVRRRAVSGLGQLGRDPRSFDALKKVILNYEKEDVHVTGDAIEALGELGDPRAIDELKKIAEAKDSRKYAFDSTAIEALGKFHEARVLDIFEEWIQEYDEDKYGAIALALGNFADAPPELAARAEDMAINLVYKDRTLICFDSVVDSLGNLRDSRALKFLEEEWENTMPRTPEHSKHILIAIAKIRDPRALDIFVEFAHNTDVLPSSMTQSGLATALGECSDSPEAISLLKMYLKNSNRSISESAAQSLVKVLGPRRALDFLNSSATKMSDEAKRALFLGIMRAESGGEDVATKKTAAAIRAYAAHHDRIESEQGRGHENRGIKKGTQPVGAGGFDFQDLRKVENGQPMSGGSTRWMIDPDTGEYSLYEVVSKIPQRQRVMVVIDPRVTQGSSALDAEFAAGTVAEMALRRKDAVGLVIGDGKEKGYLAPGAQHHRLEEVIFRMRRYHQQEQGKMSVLQLLEQGILRQNLVRGSKIYLVADFLAERDLSGLERVFARYRKLGVTVVPVQVGSTVGISPIEARIGGQVFKVHDNAVKYLHQGEGNEKAHDVEDFLEKTNGIAINAPQYGDTSAIPKQIISAQHGKANTYIRTKYRIDDKLKTDEIKFSNISQPIDFNRRLHKAIEANDVSTVKALYLAAKKNGWSYIFSWIRCEIGDLKAINEKPVYVSDLSSAELESRYADPNGNLSYDPWGYTDEAIEFAVGHAHERMEAEARARKEAKGLNRETSEYDSPLLSIHREEKISFANTGAVERDAKTSGKDKVWLKLDKRLGKERPQDQYMALDLGGKFEPTRGTYSKVDGFTLDDLAAESGSEVKGKITEPEAVMDMPVPLGGRLLNRDGERVSFELSPTAPRADVMNMKVSEFRAAAKGMYGEQYDALTETVPLKSIPPDVQALIRGIQGMTVRDAMHAIQHFMMDNFEYRPFNDVERAVHEDLVNRAARGQLNGPNEILNFVLQVRAGKCVEISEMTIALLRLAGIPAAKFDGYVVNGKKVDREAHAAAIALLPAEGGNFHAEPVEGHSIYLSAGEAAEIQKTPLPFAASKVKEESPTADKAKDSSVSEEAIKAVARAAAAVEGMLRSGLKMLGTSVEKLLKSEKVNEPDVTEKPAEESLKPEEKVAPISVEEAPKPLQPEKPLASAEPDAQKLKDVADTWQSHWDAASESQRTAISKAWEYYVYCLMYRGHKFGDMSVTKLMLDPSAYARFKPSTAQPPSYWMNYIRTLGIEPRVEDLAAFRLILQKSTL